MLLNGAETVDRVPLADRTEEVASACKTLVQRLGVNDEHALGLDRLDTTDDLGLLGRLMCRLVLRLSVGHPVWVGP